MFMMDPCPPFPSTSKHNHTGDENEDGALCLGVGPVGAELHDELVLDARDVVAVYLGHHPEGPVAVPHPRCGAPLLCGGLRGGWLRGGSYSTPGRKGGSLKRKWRGEISWDPIQEKGGVPSIWNARQRGSWNCSPLPASQSCQSASILPEGRGRV